LLPVVCLLAVMLQQYSWRSTASVNAPAAAVYADTAKQVAVPGVALIGGALCHQIANFRLPAKLLIYFGAQTGMLLLAKVVLSGAVVSEEMGLHGFPAAFLLTASQQMTTFVLFGTSFVLSWATPWSYTPKRINSREEYFRLCVFAASFSANIGLNNFSLAFLPLSLNLIIRSCLPLATALVQAVIECTSGGAHQSTQTQELLCMVAGVLCAAIATIAQTMARNGSMESEHLMLGVVICAASIFAGALNMVMASSIGKSMNMNSIDITFYMGPPATLILMIPSLLMLHPTWQGQPAMTDWQVFRMVSELSPSSIWLALILGLCASGYNVLQYSLAQALSATYTAFAGNFNKAATVAVSLAMGLESLPAGVWGTVMLLSTLGNVASFTCYSVFQVKGKKP